MTEENTNMLPAEMLATRVEEMAAKRRPVAKQNATALDSLAVYLVNLGMVGTDERALKLDLLIPVFQDRSFPSETTRALLQGHGSTDDESHERLVVQIVEAETGQTPRP